MSRKFGLAIRIILVLSVVLTMHVAALRLRLYWSLSWFDAIVHLLAGAAIGLVFALFILRMPTIVRKYDWLALIVFAGCIGIGWEVFEFVTNMTYAKEGYWIDTIQDIIADFLGAGIAYWLYRPTEHLKGSAQYELPNSENDTYERNA